MKMEETVYHQMFAVAHWGGMEPLVPNVRLIVKVSEQDNLLISIV